MNSARHLMILCLCLLASCCYAQDKKYDMSNPIEFTTTGWNKVLCMKNGNTLLFHLDPTKPLIVTVFDSLHKRIATQEHLCRVMDINTLRTTIFKGLYEINGEAVLFIEQEHLGKFGLVRLRFNSKTGKLADEKLVGESPGISKRTNFYLMKNKNEDNYAVLFSTDIHEFYKCDVHVSYYNGSHELVKDIPLAVDRKNYDYMDVVCAEAKPTGILIALDLKKMVVNATVSKESPQKAIYNHTIDINYIPKDSSRVNEKIVDISDNVSPYYSEFTYNAFAKTNNLLVFSYRPIFYKFGIDVRRGIALGNLFFKIDEDNSDIKFNWIKNDSVSAALRRKTDSSKIFYGMPVNMFTNENGLTTLITEGYERYDEPESGAQPTDGTYIVRNSRTRPNARPYMGTSEIGSRGRYDWDTYFGNIGITLLDDDGNEIWGAMLPHSEYYKSYRHYYHPKEVAKKDQTHRMFDDLPDQITQRQFVSLNSYTHNSNLYIIFNDDNNNFNNTGNVKGDTVYTFENTNACYYKMNRKKEITKSYLLGEPAKNEYKCSFIEGADFDEQRSVYATLVQYKRNDNISLRMAWCHLD